MAAAGKTDAKLSLAHHVKGGIKQSWADQEAENEPTPTFSSKPSAPKPAPTSTAAKPFERRGRPEADERGFDNGSSRNSRPAKPNTGGAPKQKEPRPELPVPDVPPFKAYIGNLSLHLTEGHLEDFLDGLKIKKVNMMNNKEGAFKGFAYVEFEDKQSLVNVLELNGMSFEGKSVKIAVASADQGEPKVRSAGSEKPARGGRGRGGVPFQRATGGPGSERFNREEADTKKPAPAPAPAAAPTEKDKPVEIDLNKARPVLKLAKKGESAAASATAAAGGAAKPKKPNPFGDAKPRELVLKSKNEVDQYAEVAPTQEEIDKLLNPPAEKPHRRPKHHDDEEEDFDSHHSHHSHHDKPQKPAAVAIPQSKPAAAAPAPAKPAAATTKPIAPKSPVQQSAPAPAPAPAVKKTGATGSKAAPWANSAGPTHAIPIKAGPNANPEGAPAAVVPGKPAAVWTAGGGAAKNVAAATAAANAPKSPPATTAAPAPAPAPATGSGAGAKAGAWSGKAAPPGLGSAPPGMTKPAEGGSAAAAGAASPTSPAGGEVNDRTATNWGRDANDKPGQRRVWNEAAEGRSGRGRGGRGRGSSRGAAKAGGARPARPVKPAADSKDGAGKEKPAKKAPKLDDAPAEGAAVDNIYDALGDEDGNDADGDGDDGDASVAADK